MILMYKIAQLPPLIEISFLFLIWKNYSIAPSMRYLSCGNIKIFVYVTLKSKMKSLHFIQRTFHRCFLPSFSSFGWGFSEEMIKMCKVNGRMPDVKWWQKLTLSLARWANKMQRFHFGLILFFYSCSSYIYIFFLQF
jgi:hypothetical protein